MFVYLITNTVNGKVYVGKTITPERRWQQHQVSARAGKAGPLYDAMREEGAAAFEFSVVEECRSEDEAFDAERAWIDRLGATDPERGYNRTSGGNGPAALGDHRYRHITAEMCWELYSAGVAAPEIAKRLGVASYQPVYRLLKRAGYSVRNAGRVRNAAATADRCWELYSQGLSVAEVGKRLGCSGPHVHRTLRRAGHSLRNASDSHSELCRAALDRARGAS